MFPLTILGMELFDRMIKAKGSMAKTKIRGLRGHPWQVPRCKSKVLEYRLLVRTIFEGLEYNSFIYDMNVSPDPNLHKVSNRQPHSTLTNAFSASMERLQPIRASP